MDFIFRSLILFFLFSGFAQALPTVGVTSVRGATSTLYSVSASGGTSPLLTQPVGSTLINSGIAASSNGYTSNALLSSSVKSAAINWGVSAASLALSATKFAMNPYVSVGIIAGTALYNYMQSAGVKSDNSGGFLTTPSILSSAPTSNCASPVSNTYDAYYPPSNSHIYYDTGSCHQGGVIINNCINTTSTAFHVLCAATYTSLPAPSVMSSTQAQTALTNNPPSDKSSVLSQLHNSTNDSLYQNSTLSDPVSDSPSITAPSSVTDSPRSSVNPDNSTTKATDTTSCTQTSSSSITCSISTVTVNTPSVGTSVTTTTVNAPPDTPLTPNQPPQKTDCEKFPTYIGCSEYGTPTTPELIPVQTIPLSNAYTSWGSGSCPAAVSLPHGVTFKYDSMCSALVILKPILIAMGLLISMFIVSGGVKE